MLRKVLIKIGLQKLSNVAKFNLILKNLTVLPKLRVGTIIAKNPRKQKDVKAVFLQKCFFSPQNTTVNLSMSFAYLTKRMDVSTQALTHMKKAFE